MRPQPWAAASADGAIHALRLHRDKGFEARGGPGHIRQWPGAGRIAGCMGLLLALPYIIILFAALAGIGVDAFPSLASWVMGALTLVAALALLASILEMIRDRRPDWFWLFMSAGAFALWGSVFRESLP